MLPMIKNGDLVLLDLNRNEPQDGIYVISINNSLLVKRLQCLPNYRMKIISENKAYEPYEVDLNTDNVRIIGKVVWQGRELR